MGLKITHQLLRRKRPTQVSSRPGYLYHRNPYPVQLNQRRIVSDIHGTPAQLIQISDMTQNRLRLLTQVATGGCVKKNFSTHHVVSPVSGSAACLRPRGSLLGSEVYPRPRGGAAEVAGMPPTRSSALLPPQTTHNLTDQRRPLKNKATVNLHQTGASGQLLASISKRTDPAHTNNRQRPRQFPMQPLNHLRRALTQRRPAQPTSLL